MKRLLAALIGLGALLILSAIVCWVGAIWTDGNELLQGNLADTGAFMLILGAIICAVSSIAWSEAE